MSKRYAYILLADEKWWKRLYSYKGTGKNLQAFVRRGLVGPKSTKLTLFYVTYPFKEIRGFATFIERVTGDARELWDSYGHEAPFKSYKEYLGFLQGRQMVTFIRFKNLHELNKPVRARTIFKFTGIRRMPRTGKYINKEIAHRLI